MAKKNFIPLCMMPFIANMMGHIEENNEPAPEPDLPYYILKRMDLYMGLMAVPPSGGPGSEGMTEVFKAMLASDALKAAIAQHKDIIVPEEYAREGWYLPSGIDKNDSAAINEYLDGIYAGLEEKYGRDCPGRDEVTSTYYDDGYAFIYEGRGKTGVYNAETGQYFFGEAGVDGKFSFVDSTWEQEHYTSVQKHDGK